MDLRRIPKEDLRIAVAFFGITRSLRLTVETIRSNLIEPARAVAPQVRLFGHFYDQERIENPRSKENGALDREEFQLLELDVMEQEQPGECLLRYDFESLKVNGDPWEDGFASLRNLVHQLHSLRRVTEIALEWKPHIVIFARPDLFYHDTIAGHLAELAGLRRQRIVMPDWSRCGGYNDRFAIAKGDEAIRAYGKRIERLAEFCALGKPPQGERLLKFALGRLPGQLVSLRASRVRANGLVVVENFTPKPRGSSWKKVVTFEAFQKTLPLPAPAHLEGH